MTTGDQQSEKMAEVLKLRLIDGASIRAISKKLKLHRKTVRKLLGLASGKHKPKPPTPRTSILAPYDVDIRKAVEDCADIRAPAVLDRLREQGYPRAYPHG